MTQEELNNLKVGDKAVDLQEYYWGENGKILAYKVTIYTCVKYLLFFKKIKTYIFPFYFASKELVERFLKFYNYFEISQEPLRWFKNINCISLVVKGQTAKYHMVDEYKSIYYNKQYYDFKFKPCALEEKGIWNGKLNDTADMYFTYMDKNYNFMKLLDKCNILVKSEKTYMFKMIEEK